MCVWTIRWQSLHEQLEIESKLMWWNLWPLNQLSNAVTVNGFVVIPFIATFLIVLFRDDDRSSWNCSSVCEPCWHRLPHIATASTRNCEAGCPCPKPDGRFWEAQNRFSVFGFGIHEIVFSSVWTMQQWVMQFAKSWNYRLYNLFTWHAATENLVNCTLTLNQA